MNSKNGWRVNMNDIESSSKVETFKDIQLRGKKLYKREEANWDFAAGVMAGVIQANVSTLRLAKKYKSIRGSGDPERKIIKSLIKELTEKCGFKLSDLEELFDILGIKGEDLE